MHTLIAYYESITNGSTYTEVNGVLDQSQTLDSASRFIMMENMQILAAYVMGINLTAARIEAPSLRSLLLPQVYPSNDTADVPTVDQVVNMYGRGPRVVKNEGVIITVSRGGADAQPVLGGLWIAPAMTPAPQGPTYTLPFTTTNVIVAGSWVLSALTPEQTLPAGRYAVVGMAVLCNDATFARLVFPGIAQYRPGCIVNDAYGDLTLNDPFRWGRFGSMGEFESTALPAIEILGDTAGSEAAVVYLDLVKVR